MENKQDEILPTTDLPTGTVKAMSDDQLHRAQRDFSYVAGRLGSIAGICAQRARALRSHMDKRKSGRLEHNPNGRDKITKAMSQLVHDKNEPVVFTDHAIIRYLERFKDLDLQALTAEMKAIYDKGTITSGGAIMESQGHGFLRSVDGKVKTILPVDWLTQDTRDKAIETYTRQDPEAG